jgi:serine-type D-Ala-D-Ala carboxypeptidase/endopeptidase (penicillin-binding protein 4)
VLGVATHSLESCHSDNCRMKYELSSVTLTGMLAKQTPLLHCQRRVGRAVATACVALIAFPALSVGVPDDVAKAARAANVPLSAISIYVREVGREQPLIDHRAYKAMNPASTMKVVTTLVALDVLTPTYQWKTEFSANVPLQGDVLNGALFIRGSGDPKFTWEHLDAVVKNLRAQGIREIRGDLILDRSRFAPATYDAAAFDGQPLRPYNASPDALLFNFKSTGFRFSPQQNGDVAITTDGPAPDGLLIDNKLRTVTGACGDWRWRIGANFEPNGATAKASFTGVYPSECGDREWYVSLLDHGALLSGTFARLWRDSGGVWNGVAKEGVVPKAARVLHTHASAPLASMVTDINKFSNNVMARQLLISFDAQLMESPGRADRGGRAMREWAKLRGFDVPELVIENGSGLSRKERISAKSMAKFLEYGLTAPFANDFVKSLPIAATDGTLSRRFVNAAANGNAFLKTGTLTGVKTLAGYLQLPGNRRFIFVGMINHANADAAVEVLDRAVDGVFRSAK